MLDFMLIYEQACLFRTLSEVYVFNMELLIEWKKKIMI